MDMVALRISDLRQFTKQLFLGDTFDKFLVKEATIVTFNTFTIDGTVRHGYYSDEELEASRIEQYSAWKVLRPFCFSLIRGNKLPESFSIILKLAPEDTGNFLKKRCSSYAPEAVGGLYLNLRYEEQVLHCVTGIALNQFLMDKTLEREWDDAVRTFLKRAELPFEEH